MSEIVRSYGYIAELKTPFSTKYNETLYYKTERYKTEQQEYSEHLLDSGSILGITYDGKCVYCDFNSHNEYKNSDVMFTQIGQGNFSQLDFFDELKKYNLDIIPESMKPYNCVWYTGCDFPIDDLTIEQIRNNYHSD